MKKIFVRSPYFIEINESGQVGSKIELRFRKAGQTYPTPANYVLSKKIASPTQTNTIYNISNYAKEFIKPIAPFKPISPNAYNFEAESTDIWCFMEVKRYKEDPAGTYTLLNTEEIVCLDGYTNYLGGYNQASTANVLPLYNKNIAIQKQEVPLLSDQIRYVNAFFDKGVYTIIYDVNISEIVALNFKERVVGDSGTFEAMSCLKANIDGLGGTFVIDLIVEQDGLFILPLFGQSLRVESMGVELTQLKLSTPNVCEPKYTPATVYFINRFGGWQPLTFFKAKSEAYEMQSVKHKLMPEFINYNTSVGQYKQFNFNGKQTVRLNTGYVPENYSELMQDLLLSETILLDGKPVIIKSQSLQIKSTLVDKLINYEVEFEYNYNLINTVQ